MNMNMNIQQQSKASNHSTMIPTAQATTSTTATTPATTMGTNRSVNRGRINRGRSGKSSKNSKSRKGHGSSTVGQKVRAITNDEKKEENERLVSKLLDDLCAIIAKLEREDVSFLLPVSEPIVKGTKATTGTGTGKGLNVKMCKGKKHPSKLPNLPTISECGFIATAIWNIGKTILDFCRANRELSVNCQHGQMYVDTPSNGNIEFSELERAEKFKNMFYTFISQDKVLNSYIEHIKESETSCGELTNFESINQWLRQTVTQTVSGIEMNNYQQFGLKELSKIEENVMDDSDDSETISLNTNKNKNKSKSKSKSQNKNQQNYQNFGIGTKDF